MLDESRLAARAQVKFMPSRTLASNRGPTNASHPMSTPSAQFAGVTVVVKANVYFDGRVVSHTVLFPDETKKTLGLIFPGSFHFDTGAPERMEIIAGTCHVILDSDP